MIPGHGSYPSTTIAVERAPDGRPPEAWLAPDLEVLSLLSSRTVRSSVFSTSTGAPTPGLLRFGPLH
jgi:hypothetical protein